MMQDFNRWNVIRALQIWLLLTIVHVYELYLLITCLLSYFIYPVSSIRALTGTESTDTRQGNYLLALFFVSPPINS